MEQSDDSTGISESSKTSYPFCLPVKSELKYQSGYGSDDACSAYQHTSNDDCVKEITDFFTKNIDEGTIKGTFDNSLTNFVAVYLMLKDTLTENVQVTFTGEEEEDSLGSKKKK